MSSDADSTSPFTVKYIDEETADNNKYTITWTFKNFHKLLEGSVREFRTHSLANKPASKFLLKIILWGKNNDVIELYFLPQSSMYFKYELMCTNQNGVSQIQIKSDFQEFEAKNWLYVKTFQKTAIYDQYKFTFTVPFPCDSLIRNVCNNLENSEMCQFNRNLGNLLTDDKHTDVTLKSANGVEYKLHKCILSARCGVLKAHFEHGTKESLTDLAESKGLSITSVIESPFDSAVLLEMITYIYSAEVPRIDDIPEKILVAADYYQLAGLKSLCEKALIKKLTIDNAVDTLELAEMYSSDLLKESTLHFIQDGRASLITETEGWKNLQSVEIVKAIFVICNVTN